MVNSNYYAMVKMIFFNWSSVLYLFHVGKPILYNILRALCDRKRGRQRAREVPSSVLRGSLLYPWCSCLQLISVGLFS